MVIVHFPAEEVATESVAPFRIDNRGRRFLDRRQPVRILAHGLCEFPDPDERDVRLAVIMIKPPAVLAGSKGYPDLFRVEVARPILEFSTAVQGSE